MANLVGPQHIALGTDLIYFPEIFDSFMKLNSINYPSDYVKANKNLVRSPNCLQPEQIIELVEMLLQKGFTEKDIKGILGENYLRVVKQVWK